MRDQPGLGERRHAPDRREHHERRASYTNFSKRLLIIYLTMTASLVLMLTALSVLQHRAHLQEISFERQIISNCNLVNTGNQKVNAALAQLSAAAATNPVRTPEERAQNSAFYSSLVLPITICPPVK